MRINICMQRASLLIAPVVLCIAVLDCGNVLSSGAVLASDQRGSGREPDDPRTLAFDGDTDGHTGRRARVRDNPRGR